MHIAERPLIEELLLDLRQDRPTYQTLTAINLSDRIELVRKGFPAQTLSSLAENMGVSREVIFKWTGIAPATAKRRIARNERLTLEESERVLSLLDMTAQVDRMVRDAGDAPDFHAGRWFARWLAHPNNSLGGQAPADYLDTSEGRDLIRTRLGQLQYGIYA